ncbi:MAG: hypothetical protein NTX33_13220 [Propionibacteriales bacterium]|nr:hypothetical protein [Propionibacteriales bacterium]
MVARAVLALVLASGLLLSGCADDGPGADPSRSPSTSPSTGATPSTSPSTGTPEAEPATGPLVEDDFFSFHLPADAEWDLARGGFTATTYDEELNAFDVATSAVPLQAGSSDTDLDADFASSTRNDPYDPPRVRGENRVVDGVPGWTAQTVEDGQLVYTFGTLQARHSFGLTFRFPEKDPRSLAWIEAVLASIQWR